MNGLILHGDKRYIYTQKFLERLGYGFTGGPLDFVVFPFNTQVAPVDTSTYDENFFKGLGKNAVIFSGVADGYIGQKAAENNLPYYPMMDDKTIQIKNAIPTTEGVLAYIVQNSLITIAAARVLVIGYGVCGRDIGKKLKALGAAVTALVRNQEKESAAMADGIPAVYAPTGQWDIIINTVPATVLTNPMLDALAPAMVIDIASKPYGLDMAYAQTLNPKSALLPGIPGKYAIKTAGEILGEYIDKIVKYRSGLDENRK